MISKIIKVEASIINGGGRPRLITCTDITKTEFNIVSLYIVLWKIYKNLLCEMQLDFVCASKKNKDKHTKPNYSSARNHLSAQAL